jgi:hypothetical protein
MTGRFREILLFTQIRTRSTLTDIFSQAILHTGSRLLTSLISEATMVLVSDAGFARAKK